MDSRAPVRASTPKERNTRRAVTLVAALEACKGVLVILASTALLSLVHKDVHALALSLVEHMHLNPAAKYPGIFLSATNALHDSRIVAIALGAAAYAALRFIEAYGLFRDRAWAEVLAAGSGAIYVPFEIVELVRQPSWLHLALLVTNLAVVGVMVYALLQRRAARA